MTEEVCALCMVVSIMTLDQPDLGSVQCSDMPGKAGSTGAEKNQAPDAEVRRRKGPPKVLLGGALAAGTGCRWRSSAGPRSAIGSLARSQTSPGLNQKHPCCLGADHGGDAQ